MYFSYLAKNNYERRTWKSFFDSNLLRAQVSKYIPLLKIQSKFRMKKWLEFWKRFWKICLPSLLLNGRRVGGGGRFQNNSSCYSFHNCLGYYARKLQWSVILFYEIFHKMSRLHKDCKTPSQGVLMPSIDGPASEIQSTYSELSYKADSLTKNDSPRRVMFS